MGVLLCAINRDVLHTASDFTVTSITVLVFQVAEKL